MDLETGRKFTMVYSPHEQHEWEAVSYQVIQQKLAYGVVRRRDLSQAEMKHFEKLIKSFLQ